MEVVKWTKALFPRAHLFKDHFMIILFKLSTKAQELRAHKLRRLFYYHFLVKWTKGTQGPRAH
jgi:hypothetical protein